MNARSSFLVCFSLGTFFLLLNHVNAEDTTQPRRNVNLSPYEQWRSAYYCMTNESTPCQKGLYNLTIAGALIVQDSDIKDFCDNGCYDHIKDVLQCIDDVKRDFFFATKQPVSYVRNVARVACIRKNKGFNTNVTNPNSATSLYGRLYMPLVSTLTTAAFIATFGV